MKIAIIITLVLVFLIAVVVVVGAILPKEHIARRSAHFLTSPSAVWTIINGSPDWRVDVKRYEIISSSDGKRSWKEYDSRGDAITFEVVESIAEQKLVTRIADKDLPFGGTWTYEIVPDNRGTTLTITEHGEVYNPVFRFISRFVIGHTAQIDKYFDSLGTRLEVLNGTRN
jgi:hypothetical protein